MRHLSLSTSSSRWSMLSWRISSSSSIVMAADEDDGQWWRRQFVAVAAVVVVAVVAVVLVVVGKCNTTWKQPCNQHTSNSNTRAVPIADSDVDDPPSLWSSSSLSLGSRGRQHLSSLWRSRGALIGMDWPQWCQLLNTVVTFFCCHCRCPPPPLSLLSLLSSSIPQISTSLSPSSVDNDHNDKSDDDM